MRGLASTIRRRLRAFAADESASSEVEYILITTMIVIPFCVLIPYLLVTSFTQFVRRVEFWVNLPFP